MKLVVINNTKEPFLDQRLRRQKAHSAASSLMLQLQINQGDQLVYVLGYPNENNNQDAIYRWVLDSDSSGPLTNESYQYLKNKLQGILIDSELRDCL